MPLEDLPPPPRSGQAVRGNKRKSAGGAAAAAQQAAGNEEGQEQQHEEGEDHVPKATEADRPTKRRATDDNAPAAVGGAAGDATAANNASARPRNQGFVVREHGLAGHVDRIRVENFMCHSNFELQLGPHVTLVSGTNGSGKSAVIQAMQVCLGATARETSRARSFAAFVKEGCHEARVYVTLWNVGEDAFLPDLFGERITIERSIKAAGGTDVKLLDERGKRVTVGKPRDTLFAMLEHFCIDVTNPLTIITQDKARQFLSSDTGRDSGRDKYDIFMEGTLLQRQLDENNLAGVKLQESSHRLAESAAYIKESEDAQASLQAKLKRLTEADRMLEHRDLLEKAVVWAHVREHEAAVARCSEAAEVHGPRQVELYTRLLEQLAANRDELQQRLKEHDEVVARNKELLNSHKANVENLLKEVRRAADNRSQKTRDRTAAKVHLQGLQKSQRDVNTKLAEASTVDVKVAEARKLLEEHQQKITAKKVEEERAKALVDEAMKLFEELKAQEQRMADEEMQGRNRIQHSEDMLRASLQGLKGIEAAKGNRLGAFGAVKLCELITANMRSFQRPPIGPLGAYISVTDGRWAVAAQTILGVCLRDFIVSCGADAALLNRLMAKAGYARASIITVNYGDPPHPIPPATHPGGGYPALLDVLVIKDELARVPLLNYLVDRFSVERVALAETESSGREVVYQNAAGPHVTLAVDQGGTTFHRKGGLTWIKRDHFVNARNCLLAADMGDMAANLRADLEAEEAQLGALREELAALVAQRAAKQAEMAAATQRWNQAKMLKTRLATECRRLEQNKPVVPEVEDEEHQVVMTQLQSIHQEIVDWQRELEVAQDALDIAEKEVNAANERVKEAERSFTELLHDSEVKANAKAEVEARLKDLEAMRNQAKAERAGVVSRLAALKAAMDKARERGQTAVAGAEQVCSREEGQAALARARELIEERMRDKMAKSKEWQGQADLTAEVLRQDIDKKMNPRDLAGRLSSVNKSIEKEEHKAGADKDQLRIMLADLGRALSLKRVLHARVSKTTSMLGASMERRRQLYLKMLGLVEKYVNAKFSSYMQRRKHLGSVKWDHERRQLTLIVQPKAKDTGDKATNVEDLKVLSGGERSYTTVAFLLAVGANTETPFRVMDEYDVFMDPVNRRMATITLLECARDHADFQYIILTPQDLSTVHAARQTLIEKTKMDMPPAFIKTVLIKPARG
eukprot:XP_001696897.1 structural maintenance of chromosomes protein 6A [Chlamydomonas reinhardtii]